MLPDRLLRQLPLPWWTSSARTTSHHRLLQLRLRGRSLQLKHLRSLRQVPLLPRPQLLLRGATYSTLISRRLHLLQIDHRRPRQISCRYSRVPHQHKSPPPRPRIPFSTTRPPPTPVGVGALPPLRHLRHLYLHRQPFLRRMPVDGEVCRWIKVLGAPQPRHNSHHSSSSPTNSLSKTYSIPTILGEAQPPILGHPTATATLVVAPWELSHPLHRPQRRTTRILSLTFGRKILAVDAACPVSRITVCTCCYQIQRQP